VWAGIIGSLTAIYSGLLAFGIDLPRPAWSNEVEELRKGLVKVRLRVSEQELEEARTKLYQNKAKLGEKEVRSEWAINKTLKENAKLLSDIERLSQLTTTLRSKIDE
jgi:hypothetical protein